MSWTDRKFHSEELQKILEKPKLEDIEIAYLLTYTEANDKNLVDIISYIVKGNYFKLSFIRSQLPYFMDEFGPIIGTNIFQIYLLIDKQGLFYLAVIFVQLIEEYKKELKYITPVAPFCYKFFFRNSALIYPV